MTPARCEVCGYRLPIVGIIMLWLESMARGHPNHRSPRWPRRRRIFVICPECDFRIMVAQEVAGRGDIVVEFPYILRP